MPDLAPGQRRIVLRFAEIVCPPQLRDRELTGALLAEFESLLGSLPAPMRSSVRIGLVVFDQAARFHPRARGRRFVRLPERAAEAYVSALLAGRHRAPATALQRLKGLVVMCYYELPAVKDQIGYAPDAYIAAVSRRRLASYGDQIRAAEAEGRSGP